MFDCIKVNVFFLYFWPSPTIDQINRAVKDFLLAGHLTAELA